MSWFILFIAGVLEAVWLFGIQKSEAFSKFPYVVLALVAMATSLLLFSISVRHIPASQAYIVWLAIGAICISFVDHYFFNHPITWQQLFFCCLIFVGVVGIKLSKG
ncbi:DMT family transporter [Agarilytica rhodophyticola]|uniref:DMT family transporter n=1 Tax=Agarilytica rhodophyticola TaxID=1737490 RepID=UPI000B343A60|nr:SMR family transporter [Agarilytica rhodophyticola]